MATTQKTQQKKPAPAATKKVHQPTRSLVKAAAKVMSAASHKGDNASPAKARDEKRAEATVKASTRPVATPAKKGAAYAKSVTITPARKPTPAAPAKKAAASKTPAKATTSAKPAAKPEVARPSVKTVKKSGPQIKTRTVVETRPVAAATSEKAMEQVVVQRPVVAAVSHQLDRRGLMSELSSPTTATTAAPAPSTPTAAGTSENAMVAPVAAEATKTQPARHTQYEGSGLQRHNSSEHELKEAKSILHPTPTPAPAPAPAVAYTPKTEWRKSQHQEHHGRQGLQREFNVPHGIQSLSTGTEAPATATAVSGRAPDGQPATSENVGAETPPQPQWKSALAGGAPGFRSSTVTGGAPVPRPAASTGHAPGLIERRFEIFQEGPAAWRWKLVNATTGSQISVSQGQPFGTADQAESAAYTESRLYKAGTSLVTRAR